MTDSNPAPSKSKNPIAHSLLQMAGQSNVITVRRPFVKFTGSLEAAMMLDQLLYWTSRSVMGGWVAKTDAEWQEELCLKRYSVRMACATLQAMKLVETEVRRFNNFPTQHYRVKLDELNQQWSEFVARLSENEQTDYSKSNSRLSENEQTLTETTNRGSFVVVARGQVFTVYEKEIGPLTPAIGDEMNALIDDDKVDLQWISDAIHEAAVQNKRSLAYVKGILKNWREHGRDAQKPVGKPVRQTSKSKVSQEDKLAAILVGVEEFNG